MGRHDSRTWHSPQATPPPASVEQVRDPAVRAIFLVIARALAMISAEIHRRCGEEPPPPP